MRGYPYGYETDKLGEPQWSVRPRISGLQDADVAASLLPITAEGPAELGQEGLLDNEDLAGYATYLAMGGAMGDESEIAA